MFNRSNKSTPFAHSQADIFQMGLMKKEMQLQLQKVEKAIRFLKLTEKQMMNKTLMFTPIGLYDLTNKAKERLEILDKILKCAPITEDNHALILTWKSLNMVNGVKKYPHVVPLFPKKNKDADKKIKSKL